MTNFKGMKRALGSGSEFEMTVGDQLKATSNFVNSLSPDHTTFPGWKRDQMSPGPHQKDVALRSLIGKRFMDTASSPMRHTFSGDFGIQQWGAPDPKWND